MTHLYDSLIECLAQLKPSFLQFMIFFLLVTVIMQKVIHWGD